MNCSTYRRTRQRGGIATVWKNSGSAWKEMIMNKLNELEALLRSWTPRHPSPKLERAWQNAEPAVGAQERWPNRVPSRGSASDWKEWPGHAGFRWARAVAPACACLLLTSAILLRTGPGLILHGGDQPAMIALAMSNQNFAPYLSGSFQPTANRLDTFGWTNGGGSPSSMRSLTPPKAIDLQ